MVQGAKSRVLVRSSDDLRGRFPAAVHRGVSCHFPEPSKPLFLAQAARSRVGIRNHPIRRIPIQVLAFGRSCQRVPVVMDRIAIPTHDGNQSFEPPNGKLLHDGHLSTSRGPEGHRVCRPSGCAADLRTCRNPFFRGRVLPELDVLSRMVSISSCCTVTGRNGRSVHWQSPSP